MTERQLLKLLGVSLVGAGVLMPLLTPKRHRRRWDILGPIGLLYAGGMILILKFA